MIFNLIDIAFLTCYHKDKQCGALRQCSPERRGVVGLKNEAALYRAWKNGVVHTTLNPKGPGAVRIHLVPPRWTPLRHAPFVVILNGYYILPLGYSWAVLLRNFIHEVNHYAGKPVDDGVMRRIAEKAVERTHRTYYDVTRKQLMEDMEEIIGTLFDIAHGRTPRSEIQPLSLREYAPHMTAPHRMDLMLSAMTKNGTWNCNCKCRHCYAAGQPGAASKELSTAQWKDIIDRCRKAGIVQLTFTGGEPTLRKDLTELVDYARWFVTRLNTNGVLLTPELCAKLYEASLDSVQVTLYSSDTAIHDPLVGAGQAGVAGCWEKTVSGLRCALEAGLDVSVNTPLCRSNQDYISTLKFLHGQGVRYVSCSGLIETGGASGGKALGSQLSLDEMDGILREAALFCKHNGMEISFTSPGRAHAETLRELSLTVPVCGACLSNMAVAPDGTAVPCQSWLGEGMGLGNMLSDNWRGIWNHPVCKKIRSMPEDEALHCPLRSKDRREGGCAQ